MFDKGWLKRIIIYLFKDIYTYIIWSWVPALCIISWSILISIIFPNYWGVLTTVGIIIVLSLTAYFAFKKN